MEIDIRTTLDIPAKQLAKEKINEICTPELKEQCKDLVVMVLSIDEYNIMINALKEVSNRKKKNYILSKTFNKYKVY